MSSEAAAVKMGPPVASSKAKSLAAKLAEVMGEVEAVAKRGRNDFHKYDYATESDVLAAVRHGLASRSVIIIPDADSISWRETAKGGPIATIKVKFTVEDGETGETKVFHIFGEGQDSGDKATYKAMTGAEKYAMLKLFLIPTGNDPEATPAPQPGASSGTPAPVTAKAQAAAKVSQIRQQQPAAQQPPPHNPETGELADDNPASLPTAVPWGNKKGTPLPDLTVKDLNYYMMKAREGLAKGYNEQPWLEALELEIKRRGTTR